ncbi:hypothetical protein DS832_02305 [Bombilactobacillus bombi]|uniref:Protein CR006 P-loop domain-containing protein n=1 Tax=Bombilactobacillus bombi TaxID=1303590 RepID=A0A3R6XTA8_9LACO|nr:AAA family ATPase [Bombilactobacillus bombi]RHW48406.1 hypothetical protein DS832_02305 [Bombilactobacillus bombi]
MAKNDKIAKIKISGGNFDENTILDLFGRNKSKHARISLLYGKNGTGKSTISRGFMNLNESDETREIKAELLDEKNNTINLSNEEKNNIYVFNEDFIDNNIGLKSDGLDTIIVIGKEKEVDEKLDELKKAKVDLDKELESQRELYDKYTDSRNSISPDFYISKMEDALRGDDNWAGRKRLINNNKSNSSVKSDTYTRFIKLQPKKSRDMLVIRFNELQSSEKEKKKISKPINIYSDIEYNETAILNLLREKIEKPELNNREKYLLSLLNKEDGNKKLMEIKTYFNKKNTICPFCYQNVSKDYASSLISDIENILNKKVEEHQQKLEDNKLLPLEEIDFDQYQNLDKTHIDMCRKLLYEFNTIIKSLNDDLSKKYNNVYNPIVKKPIGLNEKFSEVKKSLKLLENDRINYNKMILDKDQLRDKLEKINNEIAFYDIKELYEQYKKQKSKKDKEENKLKELHNELDKLVEKIEKIKIRKKSVHIAMEAINNDLEYIFFDKNRLKIQFKNNEIDGKYVLYSRGKSVSPNNISVGEKNIIGLSYFFNCIMQDQNEGDVYNNNYIIVIDDPISSFDMENKIGILSYLNYKINKFVRGNKWTHILIMSHDLQTIIDCNNFAKNIIENCHKRFPGSTQEMTVKKIENKEICNFNIEHINEYTVMLRKIYDYAIGDKPEYSEVIGNIMRRVLEAFGTFVYKKGIGQLSTNQVIMNSIEEPYKSYFENLMYRIVLNSESHTEEKVGTLNNINSFNFISDEEKERTAKDILCFIYKLNSVHLLSHLENKNGEKLNIEEWCHNISENYNND